MNDSKAALLGYQPAVLIKPTRPLSEREKYERMWTHPEYRAVAPGEYLVETFLRQVRPKRGDTVIDFGCGTGRASMLLALLGGLDVTMLDFADNCLDKDVRDMVDGQTHTMRFLVRDLSFPLDVSAKYGFCTDVMEHIPEKDVPEVMRNILKAAQFVLFQISTVDDCCGKLIGEQLHMTVKPKSWWLNVLREHDTQVLFASENEQGFVMLVSAWNDASEIVKRGVVNTTDTELAKNVLINLKRGFQHARPHEIQNTEIMILGGGPSLEDFKSDIIARREQGMPLVTLNGTYNWAIANGMKPSAQVIVDARQFNNRFVHPVVDGCKYLIASQCDPSVFDALPNDQVYIWNTGQTPEVSAEIEKIHPEWYAVHGGSTVMLRAFLLLRMLGFWRFHVYGFDSCLREDKHHAYAQPENDYTKSVRVSCGGRVFRCHVWMASQAQEFVDQVSLMGDDISMIVYGDGLIAHIIKTGAEIEELGEYEPELERV